MKTLSPKIILAVLSLLAVVACGKKGGDSAPVAVTPCATVPQPGYTCVNGQIVPGGVGAIGTGNLANNVQMQASYMQGVLSFMGTGAMTANPMMGAQDPESTIHSYMGQVMASGTVQVLNQSLCGAPVGSYVAQGTGTIQMGTVTNMTLTLSGPAQMQIMIYKAFITNPNGVRTNAAGNRFGIFQAQLMVNGMPCGAVTTY